MNSSVAITLEAGGVAGRDAHAARRRKARGLGKPETFDFLGFTHICGKTRDGRFGRCGAAASAPA